MKSKKAVIVFVSLVLLIGSALVVSLSHSLATARPVQGTIITQAPVGEIVTKYVGKIQSTGAAGYFTYIAGYDGPYFSDPTTHNETTAYFTFRVTGGGSNGTNRFRVGTLGSFESEPGVRDLVEDQRRALIARFLHRSDEPVAPFGNRLNIFLLGAFTQGFSQGGNHHAQVGFLNDSIGPDGFHQLIFAEHMPTMLNQYEQGVKRFGRQRHRRILAQQAILRGIQTERANLVDVLG
jgi:hypothetical protein